MSRLCHFLLFLIIAANQVKGNLVLLPWAA